MVPNVLLKLDWGLYLPPPPQKKKKLIEMCLWGRNTYLNIYKTCFVYSREQQLALRR